MIVADASAIVEVLLQSADAPRVAARLFSGEPLAAPHLLDVEVAQVMRRYVLRGEISDTRGRESLDVLVRLPITRYRHEPLLDRMWQLPANLTAYDAAYVAIAEALDATLVTRDRKLASATAHRAHIQLV